MFAELTDQELTSLYAKIKSGRDYVWYLGAKFISREDYNMVFEASAILNEIHAENQTR